MPSLKTKASRAIDLRTLIPGTPMPGGVFVGLIYPEGLTQALILGPEYDGKINWSDATKWAAELVVDGVTGFYLPLRPDGLLVQANLPKEFKPEYYWLGTQLASSSSYAWGQRFGDGYQDFWDKVSPLRARAVRRLAI